MQATVGRAVVKTKNSTVLDVDRLGEGVPGIGTIDGLTVNAKRLGLVFKKPDVVVILMRIQCNLLLLATGGVHKRVRVKVATLCIDMADSDTAAHHNVGGDILHSLVVEGGLELGAHEAITISRVLETDEVNGEHGHVKSKRNDDQTEYSGHEVLAEKTHGHVLVVAEKNPELNESEGANPSNGEESNPLDAHGDTQTKARKDKPEPPAQLESLGRTKLVLVGEARKGKDCESGRGDERGIKKYQTGLSKKAILKDNQARTHSSSHGAASDSFECEEHARNQEDTADSREHSHGNVGNARFNIVLANLFEIEAAVETSKPPGESDKHLGQRRVDVHKELALDVLGSETAEVDFIEDNACRLINLVDTDGGSKDHEGQDYPVVGDGEEKNIVVLDALRLVRGNLGLGLGLGLGGDSSGLLLLRSCNGLLFLGHRRRDLDWRLGTFAPRTSHGGSRVSI
jgi:hypothetical protein